MTNQRYWLGCNEPFFRQRTPALLVLEYVAIQHVGLDISTIKYGGRQVCYTHGKRNI